MPPSLPRPKFSMRARSPCFVESWPPRGHSLAAPCVRSPRPGCALRRAPARDPAAPAPKLPLATPSPACSGLAPASPRHPWPSPPATPLPPPPRLRLPLAGRACALPCSRCRFALHPRRCYVLLRCDAATSHRCPPAPRHPHLAHYHPLAPPLPALYATAAHRRARDPLDARSPPRCRAPPGLSPLLLRRRPPSPVPSQAADALCSFGRACSRPWPHARPARPFRPLHRARLAPVLLHVGPALVINKRKDLKIYLKIYN
nr:vegetative cell wall protein gp1-like [Aegilops tauschii subsp. strangulata]